MLNNQLIYPYIYNPLFSILVFLAWLLLIVILGSLIAIFISLILKRNDRSPLRIKVIYRPDGNFTLKYGWGIGKIIIEDNLTPQELTEKISKLIQGTKWEKD